MFVALFLMVWYGMVYVDLYSAIVANVSNALDKLNKPESRWTQLIQSDCNVARIHIDNLEHLAADRTAFQGRIEGGSLGADEPPSETNFLKQLLWGGG